MKHTQKGFINVLVIVFGLLIITGGTYFFVGNKIKVSDEISRDSYSESEIINNKNSEDQSEPTPPDATVVPEVKLKGNTFISPASLDGVFNYVTEEYDRYTDGNITVSNSTNDTIHFEIETVRFAHYGSYSGVAKRIPASVVTYVADTETGDVNGLCIVTITFYDYDKLTYQTADSPQQTSSFGGCRSNLGARAIFLDNSVHQKDWSIEKPSIVNLGFTKKDIEEFNRLIPGLIDEVGSYAKNANKLSTSEISNTRVYLIDTPNAYDAFACDYTDPRGYCVFSLFMKDDLGNYWILGGNTSDLRNFSGSDAKGFTYATNHDAWKNKLPEVFRIELSKIGLELNLELNETHVIIDN